MAAMVSRMRKRILAVFRGASVASVRCGDATKFRLAAEARTRYQAALVHALAIPIAMNDFARRALLPAGFADLLPPEAGLEAATVERLMALFGAQAYVRVKPPLVEFEESLLTGAGAAMARHSFRLMDPVSQRMLALRPDMTLQVARIAAVRLRNEPRPLRLCYAGQVLRVVGDALRSSRQFGQIGCELIGSAAVGADVEAVLLAATALAEIGTPGLSVDLSSPTLAAAIIESAGLAGAPVVGVQWGDEGKGKIVDWLSERADIVVRFQGGHNAGHTLVIDGVRPTSSACCPRAWCARASCR
jgi:hypothetical protein